MFAYYRTWRGGVNSCRFLKQICRLSIFVTILSCYLNNIGFIRNIISITLRSSENNHITYVVKILYSFYSSKCQKLCLFFSSNITFNPNVFFKNLFSNSKVTRHISICIYILEVNSAKKYEVYIFIETLQIVLSVWSLQMSILN